MLPDILAHIELILKQRLSLDEVVLNQLIELLKNYRAGLWLYPGVIKRKTGLPISEVYNILQLMEQEGIIESYYELYCSRCQKSSGIVVKTFNEIPKFFECEMCNKELPAIENAVIIYKVIIG